MAQKWPVGKQKVKEESRVANRDWIDHQACSLLQYINILNKIVKEMVFGGL